MELSELFESINLNGDFHTLEYVDYLYKNRDIAKITAFMNYALANMSFDKIYYETETPDVIETVYKTGEMIKKTNSIIEKFELFYNLTIFLRMKGILKTEVDSLAISSIQL